MKIIIASDIHGSKYSAEKLQQSFIKEGADKMVLLGDIYNHGPRNPFPRDYAPMEVAKILNSIKDKILVIKGNCDSEVDQMISEFTFVEQAQLLLDSGIVITCTHGHKLNKDNLTSSVGDVLAYGHFHVNMMEKQNGIWIINPGSCALPKENSVAGYILIDGNKMYQKDLDGNIINQEIIK